MESMKEKIKVLAVDDEKFNLMLLKKCLPPEDYDILGCVNAVDALQQFKKQYFDVVLLDVMMPVLDGFELRKLLRELDKERPIIFLTSLVEDFSTTMLNQISWDPYTYYMNKSFNKELLNSKVMEVVTIARTKKQTTEYYTKLESELTLAGDLQKILLPDWCLMDGKVTVSSLYRPFAKVSGDIFEFFRIDQDRYLLFIGDIVGHGISAALYMSAIQAFLKVSAIGKTFKVHELLNDLNSFFCNELESTSYMTSLVAVIDFARNHITVQTAGHPGLLACSAKNESTWKIGGWEKGGIPIGWFPATKYSEADTCEADFQDDTIIVGLTDGIFDLNMKQGGKLSMEEMFNILGVLSCDADVVTLPYRLLHSLIQMQYDQITDDICVVALQKNIRNPRHMDLLFPAMLPEVGKAAQAVSAEVRKFYPSPELSAKIELLIHEYLNNVILHGIQGTKSAKNKINLSVDIHDSDDIVIQGRDRGRFWEFKEDAADTKKTEALLGGRGTSGRGLAIIRQIAKSINRSTYCGLNDTKFIISTQSGDNSK